MDGFNFYYGLRKKRWRKYYWLDMVKLFESFMRPNQELVAVKYFSARVEDDGKSLRQNAFFQANQMNPKFKLILGKYLRKKFKCKNCDFLNDTYEEKESDVRIATQIVADAFRKNCDISIVVSADSDMIPAMELAMEERHPVFAYPPPVSAFVGHRIDVYLRHPHGTLREPFPQQPVARHGETERRL